MISENGELAQGRTQLRQNCDGDPGRHPSASEQLHVDKVTAEQNESGAESSGFRNDGLQASNIAGMRASVEVGQKDYSQRARPARPASDLELKTADHVGRRASNSLQPPLAAKLVTERRAGDRTGQPATQSLRGLVTHAVPSFVLPGHLASSSGSRPMPHLGMQHWLETLSWPTPLNPLVAFSDHTAQLVEHAARSVVAVHGGPRWSSSGIHWRSGVIVTAEEVLERDEGIKVTVPGGRIVEASLAGRDPTTDVAVLRFQPNGLPIAATADAPLHPGQVVLVVGNHQGAPLAAMGIVALAGGPWHSARGGTIDRLIRLDLALSPAGEGGALVDVQGQIAGMTVLGPRRRALAIPSSTVDRVVDQLLAKGHVYRGYLGAGLQTVRLERASKDVALSGGGRGVFVVSIDPDGPAARAGMLVGDIVAGWNAEQVDRVRDVMRFLGPDSVGKTVDLELLRGGKPTRSGSLSASAPWPRRVAESPPHCGRARTMVAIIDIFLRPGPAPRP